MSEHSLSALLPETKLGSDRHLEMSHSYHGDIIVSTWQGLEEAVNVEGAQFGFAHGSDTIILAAMAGYLRRSGMSTDDVGKIMCEAGSEVLSEEDSSSHSDSFMGSMLKSIAEGKGSVYYDKPSIGLRALATPTPRVPGLIEDVGGTAMYTRDNDLLGEKLFVLAQYTMADEAPETAEFCQEDIPTMARLACNLSLGDYRRDVKSFLLREYSKGVSS